jgi:hypothetical protein
MAFVRQHPDYPKFRVKKGVMPDFSGSNYSDQETPTGIMNKINRLFSLANIPIKPSDEVFKDGMKMARASTLALTDGDYYIDYATGQITFSDTQIPQENSVIRVSYKFMRAV